MMTPVTFTTPQQQTITLRPAADPGDVDRVVQLGNQIHQDHQEHPDVFHSRFTLFPQGLWLAEREDGRLLGYAVSHPLALNASVPLDVVLTGPLARDVLYIHDVATDPAARGLGLGERLLDRLIAVAKAEGIGQLALTALDGLAPYWARFGFVETDVPALRAKLASYGPGAAYMLRAL
ncbi:MULTISPECIES: GNAT family N-acetyltransferase [unclassified Azospirillum]|uniref:GNAT family N-acetyltransferase n=1 Tax=unclassified Azospirillum TaxID=2630922 RepID=UPI000B6AEA2D|nr:MULTISPECIES: GNAT family N-acetyltransferase [unclassified Azospirillum]SNS12214.1 Acetyltransferase (GNAT) family protein [Azospirillum sp. RU38E]SNS29141.1 Acetyltransferase (GNAT) family protein [Azospirillum sp. RU37A]